MDDFIKSFWLNLTFRNKTFEILGQAVQSHKKYICFLPNGAIKFWVPLAKIESLQPYLLDTFAMIEIWKFLYFTYFTRNFSFNHVLGLEGNHYSTFLFTREQQWFHLLCQLVTFQWHLSSGFSWIWHQAQFDFQNSIVSIAHFRAALQQIKIWIYRSHLVKKINVIFFQKIFDLLWEKIVIEKKFWKLQKFWDH